MTGRRVLLLLAVTAAAAAAFLELFGYLFTHLTCGGTGCG